MKQKWHWILNVLTVLVLLAFMFPFVWMVLASFKTQAQITSADHLFIFKPTLANYVTVIAENKFQYFILNSIIIATSATICSLVLGLPAAFSIANNKLHSFGMIILFVKIIPGIIFLIPLYTIFSKLHMVGTYPALILAHMLICLPYIIWIMIPFFETFPKEIQESALIDGSSNFRMFLSIVLPISAPGFITASLLAFIHSWNNFMFSLILSNSATKPLPVAIYNFISDSEINWGAIMTAATIVSLPIIIISLLSQRYIVSGLSAGAVKG